MYVCGCVILPILGSIPNSAGIIVWWFFSFPMYRDLRQKFWTPRPLH